jgi:hypothetical protein
LTDPELTNSEKMSNQEKEYYLDPTEELFLLALRPEKPARPNCEYVAHLATYYGTVVSTTFIPEWFKMWFNHKGSFCKQNLVPLDKFWQENVIRFIEYKLKCQLMFDHSRFCFIDKKQLVNSDSVPKKLQCCPLSGRMDFIAVSGDFRETYNLVACMSGNPHKERPLVYTIGKETGTATAFISFCEMMVLSGWLHHDEIVVLGNAAIHTGGDSEALKRLFWETVVGGRPLQILVIYLPTRSPELNPIELIFHIFSCQVTSYRLRHDAGPVDRAIIRYGTQVLNNISYETIL